MVRTVNAFLEGKQFGCEACEEAPATFLGCCAKIHAKPLCENCASNHDSMCECGSGACVSGDLVSFLSRDGTEIDYSDFQTNVLTEHPNKKPKTE